MDYNCVDHFSSNGILVGCQSLGREIPFNLIYFVSLMIRLCCCEQIQSGDFISGWHKSFSSQRNKCVEALTVLDPTRSYMLLFQLPGAICFLHL